MHKLRRVFGLYDAGKALSHCEMCLDGMKSEDISDHPYEFFYNSFVYYVDQAWKLAENHFKGLENNREIVDEVIEDVYSDRHGEDDLIHYMRHARNQLTHEKAILHFSEEKKGGGKLGDPVEVIPYQYTRSTDRYSTIVMPSFRMSFGVVNIYSSPVTGHKEGLIVTVPDYHQERRLENNPTKMAELTYEYYGSCIERMHDNVRST